MKILQEIQQENRRLILETIIGKPITLSRVLLALKTTEDGLSWAVNVQG